MSDETKTVLLELLCVASALGFCLVVWWPAMFLVLTLAAGFAAWNLHREGRK